MKDLQGSGLRNLERGAKCPHAVKRRYGYLCENFKIKKIVRRVAGMKSRLENIIAEVKAGELVRK
jgi:hypothetical protein